MVEALHRTELQRATMIYNMDTDVLSHCTHAASKDIGNGLNGQLILSIIFCIPARAPLIAVIKASFLLAGGSAGGDGFVVAVVFTSILGSG